MTKKLFPPAVCADNIDRFMYILTLCHQNKTMLPYQNEYNNNSI